MGSGVRAGQGRAGQGQHQSCAISHEAQILLNGVVSGYLADRHEITGLADLTPLTAPKF